MNVASLKPLLLLSLSLPLLAACQSDSNSEYYGDLTQTPAGLVLEFSEHGLGWGRTDCNSCHLPNNFHQDHVDRVGTFDMQAIRDIVNATDTTSCVLCHGDNGTISP